MPDRLFARYVRDQQDVARLRERFASWPRSYPGNLHEPGKATEFATDGTFADASVIGIAFLPPVPGGGAASAWVGAVAAAEDLDEHLVSSRVEVGMEPGREIRHDGAASSGGG